MITGANATIYVSDLDRSVDFYTRVLGCRQVMHVPGHWAQVEAGTGCAIGLHPIGPHLKKPLGRGAMSIGLMCDGPIDTEVQRLKAGGVGFASPPSKDGPISLAHFADPDGNPLYLASYS